MEKNDKKSDLENFAKELLVQNISSITKVEMISCEKCNRKTPSNKAQCLYCGVDLKLTEFQSDSIKPNLRKPESWESGFNLVYFPNDENFSENEIQEIASFLNLENDFLMKVIENKQFFPIIRLESRSEAEIIRKKLTKRNFNVEIVSDESLDLKNPLKRLRKIEFESENLKITLFNSSEIIEIPREEICLIVSGSIYERKTEVTEKYVKAKENKTLSVNETAKDEKIIDIYGANDLCGFRILTSGFDFSGLKKEMTFSAFENIGKIFEKLKEFATNAEVYENYDLLRDILGGVWEIEEIRDSRGISKKGIGNFNLNKALINTNLTQFTKYSRLQRKLI